MERRAPRSAVLGACGFLGSHLCEVLAQAGHELVALDAPGRLTDSERAFPSVVRGLGADPQAWGPGSDWSALLEGIDLLFVALEDPREAPLAAALDAAAEVPVRKVVLISDAVVYGERGDVPAEEELPDPTTPRARALLAAEDAVRSAGPPHVVLRPAGVYGPRGRRGLRAARRAVSLVAEDFEPAPFLHVRDLARAALHVAVSPQVHEPVYNLGDESFLSAAEANRLLARLTGHACLRVAPSPALLGAGRRLGRALSRWRAPRERAPRCDARRLARTGFALEYPQAARGLRETVEWFKQEGWLA
ncbi:MAG: NAD-dependent epimerase/dehydratase family protein [Planctomycetota bacterium]